jgi:hypothetical protein
LGLAQAFEKFFIFGRKLVLLSLQHPHRTIAKINRCRWLGLVLLLMLSALSLPAQRKQNKDQMPDVEPFRHEVRFNDPYEDLPPADPNRDQPQPLDTTRRRLQVQYDTPAGVDSLLRIYRESKDTLSRGYRVQIYLGKRSGATEARFKFMEHYEGYQVYSIFERPFYKVRVGNFRNRYEAQQFRNKVNEHFPAAFVVPDVIEPQ